MMPQISFSEIALDETVYRFIAIDVETANSDPSSICQIGLAMVTDSNEIITTSTMINPARKFAAFNIKLHGIDQSHVAGAPTFLEFMRAARPLLERHPLIQHSPFDKRAFNEAADHYGTPKLKANWFDSVTIARRAWPELKGNGGHGLASLKKHLDLEFSHHDAEEDAYAASMVTLMAERVTGETFDRLTQPQRQKFEKSISLIGNQNGPLYGHVACFTGKLVMSRTEAATIAAGAGIEVKTSVSKKISLLVVGDQDLSLLAGNEKSTKHRKAEELIEAGTMIQIIGETEFRKIITDGDSPTRKPTAPPPPTPRPVITVKDRREASMTNKAGSSEYVPAPITSPPALTEPAKKARLHGAFKIYYAVIAALAALIGYQSFDIGLAIFAFSLLAIPVFISRAIWNMVMSKIR